MWGIVCNDSLFGALIRVLINLLDIYDLSNIFCSKGSTSLLCMPAQAPVDGQDKRLPHKKRTPN